MPIYNAAPYLNDSINSVLCQTFGDFEFLIVDDGSSDGTQDLLMQWDDPRIRVLKNESNRGLIYSLNRGVLESKGIFIARMDADDFSLPDRLQQQIEFMQQHPDVAVCGMQMEDMGGRVKLSKVPEDPDEIKAALLFSCVISHPTVMLRKSVIHQHELVYDPAFPHAEDYALWVKLGKSYSFANLKSVGVRYRLHDNQVSRVYEKIQKSGIRSIHKLQLFDIGIDLTDRELDTYFRFSYLEFEAKAEFVEDCQKILVEIFKKGALFNYQPEALRKVISARWYGLLSFVVLNNPLLLFKFFNSPASNRFLTFMQRVKLIMKFLIKLKRHYIQLPSRS